MIPFFFKEVKGTKSSVLKKKKAKKKKKGFVRVPSDNVRPQQPFQEKLHQF